MATRDKRRLGCRLFISDCWAGYVRLPDEGYTHLTVNHTVGFVDRQTRPHQHHLGNVKKCQGFSQRLQDRQTTSLISPIHVRISLPHMCHCPINHHRLVICSPRSFTSSHKPHTHWSLHPTHASPPFTDVTMLHLHASALPLTVLYTHSAFLSTHNFPRLVMVNGTTAGIVAWDKSTKSDPKNVPNFYISLIRSFHLKYRHTPKNVHPVNVFPIECLVVFKIQIS
jgi:hypothetical protein